MKRFCRSPFLLAALFCLLAAGMTCMGQAPQGHAAAPARAAKSSEAAPQPGSAKQLEQEFFAVLRAGDAKRFLNYVAGGGVNVGPQAQHVSRAEVEDELTHRSGIYCKLFESSCIASEIRLDNSSVRACSYRELLTSSKDLHTAATETTRNGVRQAIVVARMKNDGCSGVGLIDFIFNLQADGWKLFSIP